MSNLNSIQRSVMVFSIIITTIFIAHVLVDTIDFGAAHRETKAIVDLSLYMNISVRQRDDKQIQRIKLKKKNNRI